MREDYPDIYRPRDLGQMLNLTFAVLRYNAAVLAKSLLVMAGPLLVATAAASYLLTGGFENEHGTDPMRLLRVLRYSTSVGYFPVATIVSGMLGLLLTAMVQCVTHAVVMLHAERDAQHEGPITVDDVWEKVKKWILHFTGGRFILGIVTGLGFMCLVIPGIYLWVLLVPGFMVMMREGTGLGSVWGRCRELMAGNWWNTLLLVLVLLVLEIFLQYFFGFGMNIFRNGILSWVYNYSATALVPRGALGLADQAVQTLITVPLLTAAALQYYNLSETHGGHGLDARIDQIGTTTDTDAY